MKVGQLVHKLLGMGGETHESHESDDAVSLTSCRIREVGSEL
jgi:hypothetical protein